MPESPQPNKTPNSQLLEKFLNTTRPALPPSLPVWISHNIQVTKAFPYIRVDLGNSQALAISYFLTHKIKGKSQL